MPKRIFIEGITSPLGSALYQEMRDDHIDIDSFSLISGSVGESSEADNRRLFHYDTNQNLTLKMALECDLVILDLVRPTQFTEILLRYLKSIKHRKPMRIIGISLFTNWAHSRKHPLSHNADPLEALKQKIDFAAFSQQQYAHRVPLHSSVYNYELQNLLLSLNHNRELSGTIICRGLLYGKDYFELEGMLSSLITHRDALNCYGEGHNYIPMIHIDDLCRIIHLFSEEQTSNKYAFAVDDSHVTQLQLLSCLSEAAGLFKENRIVHISDHLQENLYCCNLKLKRSPLFDKIEWTAREGIISHKPNILEQFSLHQQYQTFRFLIVGNNNNLRGSCQKQLKEEFGDKLVISQETLAQYIKQVEQDRSRDEELADLIQTSGEADVKRKPDEAQLQYPNPVLEKALQSLLQKHDTIGYIINLPQYLVNKVTQVSDPTIVIQCDLNEQQTKPQTAQSRSKAQSSLASSKNFTILDRYRIIQYEGKEYKQLFKDYKPEEKAEPPQQQPQQEDKCEQKHSFESFPSQKDVDEEPSNKSQSFHGERQGQPSKVKQMKARLSMMNQNNLFSVSMKQYIVDTIMPAIIGGIYEIQEVQPENIPLYFIEYLKRQGEKGRFNIIDNINFKLKSQKAIARTSVHE